MKYFNDNKFSGIDLEGLHICLAKSSEVVQNNLFFHQAHDGADCERHRLLLAMSAYNVIAVCEAVIDRVTYAERDKALSDIRSIVQMDVDDASDAMAKLFIGALFGMGD